MYHYVVNFNAGPSSPQFYTYRVLMMSGYVMANPFLLALVFFQVAEWPVGPSGLLYDRSWVVVLSATKSALSLKQHPLLCSVRPSIDRSRGTMLVEATG